MWWLFRKKSSLYEVDRDYSGPPDQIATCWITNIDDPNVEVQWGAGSRMCYPIPPVIIYEVDRDVPLKDLMVQAGGPILVSDDLASLMRGMSSCAVFYDSEVHHKQRIVRRDCKTVHFETAFPCLDMRLSRFQGPHPIRLVVDESKVPRAEHVFLISECPNTLVCDQTFIDEVDSMRLSGIHFDRMLC